MLLASVNDTILLTVYSVHVFFMGERSAFQEGFRVSRRALYYRRPYLQMKCRNVNLLFLNYQAVL